MLRTIQAVLAVPKNSVSSLLDNEIKLIEGCQGKRGEETEKLFQALLTIQPTTTSCERVFSVASGI